jgi:regulator of RNase E activity RraA
VPVALAAEVIQKASEHHGWEEFSRMKLMQGAPLQRYYPLHADAWHEYEAWQRETGNV